MPAKPTIEQLRAIAHMYEMHMSDDDLESFRSLMSAAFESYHRLDQLTESTLPVRLGRPIDKAGRPVDSHGHVLLDPDGNPLPPAPRTRVCQAAARAHDFRAYHDGSWYRCCGGHVRQLLDCCGYVTNRINGDAALTGYCYRGRHVFCVTYYDTKVKC